MLSSCLKYRTIAESKNLKVVKSKKGRIILLSKCSVCNSKKSKQEQERIIKQFERNKNTDSKWFTHNKYFILKV